MRRMLGLTLALLLAVLPTTPAFAQFASVGPGGIVHFSTASTTCVNTTTASELYGYDVPVGLMATSSIAPASATTAAANIATSPPMHFKARGILSTGASPGSVNVGVNYGGSTATLALINAVTPTASLSNVPLTIDVWVAPLATGRSANTVTVSARLAYQLGTSLNLASEVTFNAQVIGTTTFKQSNELSVNWLWGTGNNSNSVTLHQRSLSVGD